MSVLTAHEVADLLKLSHDLFLRTRASLEERGFPKPLNMASRARSPAEVLQQKPRQGRARPPLRWSEARVRAWIDGGGVDDDGGDQAARKARALAREGRRLDQRLGIRTTPTA